MEYISVKEASKKWGISERRVRILCSENRIDGVTKSSWAWNIPSNVEKPSDGRTIRHIKNVSLRIDSINLKSIIEKKEEFNKIVKDPLLYQKYFDQSITKFLLMAFSQEPIDPNDIIRVLNKERVVNLDYNTQLLILNAKSILVECYKQTGYGPVLSSNIKAKPYISEHRLNETYEKLFKSIDDFYVPEYKTGTIPNLSSMDDKEYDISLQMETLIFQYEREWINLDGLVKASFMFAQLLRLKPFARYDFLFASLIFAQILLEDNYPLAFISIELIPELKANLTLTLNRSNYTKLIRMFESSIEKELDNLLSI